MAFEWNDIPDDPDQVRRPRKSKFDWGPPISSGKGGGGGGGGSGLTATIRIVRKGDAGAVIEKLAASLKGPTRVKIGFPAGEASSSNIMKAIYNEFGTRGGRSGGGWGGPIPERPFMRNSVKRNEEKYRDQLRSAAKAILKGEIELENVLRRLGITGQYDIQAEITATLTPPNAPATIKRKGSSHPLIDTGAMRAAVTWKIDE